ncbi:MAG: hypothetical protein LBR64_01055 [Dysgonamonadaceae bacterium]|jgi:hypothetical protein|nr:hypothetical protein [Dysgonamonadaceae bacterium]
MESQKPRIEFYRSRTFSEKLNATFDFIRENWKPLLKYTFFLAMPLCLIQAYAQNLWVLGAANFSAMADPSVGGFGASVQQEIAGFGLSYGVMMLCGFVASILITSLVYALMDAYGRRENRLAGVTYADFSGLLWKNARRSLSIILFYIAAIIVFVVIAVLLATISKYLLAIVVPLTIFAVICLIPLSLTLPIYLFEEETSLFAAVGRAWRFGFRTFGGVLGLMIVLGLIAAVIQIFTTLPWYIALITGSIMSGLGETAMSQSIIFKFGLYILGLIQTFGVYIASTITIIGLAFHYFSTREEAEGVAIDYDITNFENL